MKKWLFFSLLSVIVSSVSAENNATTADKNTTVKSQLTKHVSEQIKLEEHYSKTQSFEQGKDYNLSIHQVDKKDLDSIPVIEPEYDFNMDDVYD